MKKVGKILSNIIIVIVLVFSILMTVMVISSTKDESGLPNLFGKAIFNVLTDSMLSEEGFPEGSLIVVELTDKEEDVEYKVGDVVTFWRYYEDQPYLETHRIVEDTYTDEMHSHEIEDGVWVHGGESYYITKGDNTPDIDLNQDLSIDYLTKQRIVAKWTGIAIPHLGTVLSFLQSQLGFMLCVVIPTAIFFFFELFKFISALMEAKKEKAVAAVKDAEEEIKQRLMAELGVKAQANDAPDKPADDKPKETEEDIKKKAIEEFKAQQEAEKRAAEEKAAAEEEIKKKAVEEYLAAQAAEKAAAEQAAKEEELKKQAIAEYLAQQEAEKAAARAEDKTGEENTDSEETVEETVEETAEEASEETDEKSEDADEE